MKKTLHLRWIALLFLACIFSTGSRYVYTHNNFIYNQQRIKHDKHLITLSQHVTQLLDDARTAEQLKSTISEKEIKAYLSTTTREIMIKNITDLLEPYNISSFSYTLSPSTSLYDLKKQDEMTIPIGLSEQSQKTILSSDLIMEGKALNDNDIISYLKNVKKVSQGFFQIEKLSIEPTDPDHFDRSKTQENVRFTVHIKWAATIDKSTIIN